MFFPLPLPPANSYASFKSQLRSLLLQEAFPYSRSLTWLPFSVFHNVQASYYYGTKGLFH